MEVWDPSQKGNLDWNHAWGAAPGNIVPRRLFGIMPIQPGYREFEVKPRVGSLTGGSYRLPTLAGEIAVSFTSAPGEHLKLTVTVPENSSGKVCLPRFNMSNSAVTLDGASVQGIPEGDFVYVDSLSPGTHTVERGTRTSVPLVSGGVVHSRPSIPLVTVHNRRLRIDVADGDPSRKYTVNIGTVDGRRNARFAATGNKSRYWVASRPGCYVVTIGDEDGTRILRKVVPVN